MTTSRSTSAAQNAPQASVFSGCLITTLVLLCAILGVYNLVSGSLIAYVFSSANMLSPFHLGIILVIACQCFIYFFLVFRIKRQPWLITLALLVVVWLVLPLSLRFMINSST